MFLHLLLMENLFAVSFSQKNKLLIRLIINDVTIIKWDRIKDLYIVMSDSLGNTFANFQYLSLFANFQYQYFSFQYLSLAIFLFILWLKFSFSCKRMPKCFWQVLCTIGASLKWMISLNIFLEKITSWAVKSAVKLFLFS